MIIYGIHLMNGIERDFRFAKVIALAPVSPFENAKIKIDGIGLNCKTDTKGNPKFPAIDFDYAKKLVDTRAFVTGKDYELKLDIDLENLEPVIVELIPTDAAVLKHFNECLGIK